MTALRGRTLELPPLLLAVLPLELLWEEVVLLGFALVVVEGCVAAGVRADGLAEPDGRLLLGALLAGFPLLLGLLPLAGFPFGFVLLVGLALAEGSPLPEGCAETGLFSAKTGSFTAGFS